MGKIKTLPNKIKLATSHTARAEILKRHSSHEKYVQFDQLDGRHAWQESVPEGFVSYQVRQLNHGKVAYFNFALAKEMGLIPEDHPEKITDSLAKKILETFCIRIINEYDVENKTRIPKASLKPHRYMATRYLQLQHSNKKGQTSGDGRCIWNGQVSHKGLVWDVSSRGTGVTCLAPGAVAAGKPLKSGNEDYGYGCGLAEIDELYSAIIMAEIFHCNKLQTERVLTVIDLGGGYGIGVRAGHNLFRPAHLFMYLKQENHSALKKATDFLIARQVKNKEWHLSETAKDRFSQMLKEIAISFAKFTARLERDFIFAWLDWDGDNVLANAGIIDYGSVRQFGLRHDQYRYDDVDRFSTNLNEQRLKARMIVQVFAQLTDYIYTKNRKPLHHFKNHSSLNLFDRTFASEKQNHFLHQCGFRSQFMQRISQFHQKEVQATLYAFEQVERIKTHKKSEKVADGVNRPAIINSRKLLCETIEWLTLNEKEMNYGALYSRILSNEAVGKDRILATVTKRKLRLFVRSFAALFNKAANEKNRNILLGSLRARCASINRQDRVTGNAVLYIVSEIIAAKKRGVSHWEIQSIIDNFIASQILLPEVKNKKNQKPLASRRGQSLMKVVLSLAAEHGEDI